jgi:hypothetical protein
MNLTWFLIGVMTWVIMAGILLFLAHRTAKKNPDIRNNFNLGEKHIVTLNDYHVANLRALINAIGYPWNDGAIEESNPFWAANTGDWVGEIYWKLPEVDFEPNATGEEMANEARKWTP